MDLASFKELSAKVNSSLILQTTLGVAVLSHLYRSWRNRIDVPTYGGILSFSRLLSTVRLAMEGGDIWRTSYAKYPMILVPSPERWAVVVRGKYIDELSRAPDDVLSFTEATHDSLRLRYSLGTTTAEEHEYHIHVVRQNLTKRLPALFPEVYDEVIHAFGEDLQFDGAEWKEVEFLSWIIPVVAKASNRVFVGLPLCRDKEWLSLVIDGAVSCIKTAAIINLFPEFMHPIVGPLISKVQSRKRKAAELARYLIDDRLKLAPEDRPDDYISWLLSAAPPEEQNAEDITQRIISTNFAAIHTSSLNMTHTIYWLLSRPEYLDPLREEIESVTSQMGWTKAAISSMPKLESFMKESMRLSPLAPHTMNRKVVKPFTFSNGVSLPVGATVGIHLYATQVDEDYYPEPLQFKGFRFVEEENGDHKEAENVASLKSRNSMYAISRSYLGFSYGRHAWQVAAIRSCRKKKTDDCFSPGRFFASMELKTMFAYLIANYDMKWPDSVSNGKDGYRPADIWMGAGLIPDPKGRILIRERSQWNWRLVSRINAIHSMGALVIPYMEGSVVLLS
ncbi:hypothetical protein FRC20_011209 [Serendipita sp. 405]|nr:hypothetical protein FRC20_011209 [Serendipita sp. 405]